jgi:tRNA pseudouridine synthase 10
MEIDKKIILNIKNKLKEYKYSSFLLGFKQQALDNKIKEEYRKAVAKKLNKKLELLDPDLHIIIDLEKKNNIEIRCKPIFFYGRYKKFVRDIPQTYWGKNYRTSVEDTIGKASNKFFKPDNYFFHGAGREDVDVLMLGTGRPFVFELKNAKIRKPNLAQLRKEINKSKDINVSALKFCKHEDVTKTKEEKFDKTYIAKVVFDKMPDSLTLLEAVQTLNNVNIEQRTPNRVAHRRSDLIRKRKVYLFKIVKKADDYIVFEIKTESGTYIKELISGDQMRTKPSLSSLIKIPCKIKELDVIKIG